MEKQWKQCQTLFFGAPKSLQMVTAAMKLKDACSLEENYDQPRQNIYKQRLYFANKGPSSQSYGFSSSQVRMWEAEHQRTDALELCCWRCLSPLDCKEIKPVQPQEISPEYSLDGLMLTLKLQYFGHLMKRTGSLEKTLMLGKIEAGGEGDDRGWDGWIASPTQCTWIWTNSGR